MRAFWKRNAVISIKLSEDCYSLAQMVNDSAKMRFFPLFHATDEWKGVNLNEVEPLFTVSIGNVVIQRLGQRRIPADQVTPSNLPCERLVIESNNNSEGYRLRDEFWEKGGNLVDVGEDARLAGCQGSIVKKDLNIDRDFECILKYPMSNMYGDRDVVNRLLRFKRDGLNIDPYKFYVFPGLLEKMKLDESEFEFGVKKPSDFHKNIKNY